MKHGGKPTKYEACRKIDTTRLEAQGGPTGQRGENIESMKVCEGYVKTNAKQRRTNANYPILLYYMPIPPV